MDNTTDKWNEKGITFRIPTLDDKKQVDTFLKVFFLERPQVLCKPHYGNSHLEMVACKLGTSHLGYSAL